MDINKKPLQQFIGQKNTKAVQERIKQTVEAQIRSFAEKGLIHPPITQTPVETLWQSWS